MSEIDRIYAEAQFRKGTGWLAFAGAMLVVSGIFKILDALWAFKYDDKVSNEVQTIVFSGDLTAWGWIWLALGIVLIVAGFAVVNQRAQWARWFGVVAAGTAAIVNYSWIFTQPIWTLVTQGILLAVIYALLVFGGSREYMR